MSDIHSSSLSNNSTWRDADSTHARASLHDEAAASIQHYINKTDLHVTDKATIDDIKQLLIQDFGEEAGRRFNNHCESQKVGKKNPLTNKDLQAFLKKAPKKVSLDLNNLREEDSGRIITAYSAESSANKTATYLEDKPTSFQVLRRGEAERAAHRKGMDQVRQLLLEKFDSNAVERFDKHFAYRYSMGKPLSIRALKVFVEKEKELRKGTLNVSQMTTLYPKTDLEHLKGQIDASTAKENLVIGAAEKKITGSMKQHNVLTAISLSWFETEANTEMIRKAKEEGVKEARKLVVDSLVGHCTTIGIEKVENTFDQKFVTSKQSASLHMDSLFHAHIEHTDEAPKVELTVETLSSFVDESITARDYANSLVGQLSEAGAEGRDQLQAKVVEMTNYLKKQTDGVVKSVAHIFESALILKATASSENVSTIAAKDAIIAGTLATGTPFENLCLLFLAR